MQAQAPCLPIASSPASGAEAGVPGPAERRDGAPSVSSTGAAAEPTAHGGHPGWTAALLAERSPSLLRDDMSRFGIGVGLASLYGLALGARQGGVSLVQHAAGVPAAVVAVAGLGVPALLIVLTLFNAPLDPPRALSATARAAAATGLVLGGLAPAAALFVVTSGSDLTAALLGLLGLAVGGVLGVHVLLRDLRAALRGNGSLALLAGHGAALLGFAGFAVALALRVWWATLPILKAGAL
ncbi:hypothetical protein [Sorangium cellulosum]|uniref:Uncharacterized protein n=1 Tax=Sorangium cellulosum TaxID=56 RepID=A0A150QAM0_SORCE|nr:hypothetical protein [Sorangium cellulosum]KYF65011.1 hypothetical protein BE15_12890 [Sorangium cellulosum]